MEAAHSGQEIGMKKALKSPGNLIRSVRAEATRVVFSLNEN